MMNSASCWLGEVGPKGRLGGHRLGQQLCSGCAPQRSPQWPLATCPQAQPHGASATTGHAQHPPSRTIALVPGSLAGFCHESLGESPPEIVGPQDPPPSPKMAPAPQTWAQGKLPRSSCGPCPPDPGRGGPRGLLSTPVRPPRSHICCGPHPVPAAPSHTLHHSPWGGGPLSRTHRRGALSREVSASGSHGSGPAQGKPARRDSGMPHALCLAAPALPRRLPGPCLSGQPESRMWLSLGAPRVRPPVLSGNKMGEEKRNRPWCLDNLWEPRGCVKAYCSCLTWGAPGVPCCSVDRAPHSRVLSPRQCQASILERPNWIPSACVPETCRCPFRQ